MGTLTGVMWFLNVVLTFTFLIISDVDDPFVYLLTITSALYHTQKSYYFFKKINDLA